MPIYIRYDGIKGDVQEAHSGAHFALGDGSVRGIADGTSNTVFADGSVRGLRDSVPTADAFDFTTEPQDDDIALLLPAVQAAREAARAGDGSVMPDDAQGIIAILIGLAKDDAPFDPGFTGGVFVGAGDVSGDDVVVDGRIITAEDWF